LMHRGQGSHSIKGCAHLPPAGRLVTAAPELPARRNDSLKL
jgi:hypothetical protein